MASKRKDSVQRELDRPTTEEVFVEVIRYVAGIRGDPSHVSDDEAGRRNLTLRKQLADRRQARDEAVAEAEGDRRACRSDSSAVLRSLARL